MTIGERMRNARKAMQLTQKELADQTGLAEITIRNYEADKYKPKHEPATKIAHALDMDDANELLYGESAKLVKVTEIDGVPQRNTSLVVYPKGHPLHIPSMEEREDVKNKLLSAFDSLNDNGKVVAADRVDELSEIPRYQKKES